LALLLEHVSIAARQEKRVLEIRDRLEPGSQYDQKVSYWSHVAYIDRPEDQLIRGLHADVRRLLRRSEKAGLTHEIRRDPEAMQTFYDLHLLTRRRHGVPIQPRRYFTFLQQHVVDAGLGFVSLTRKDSRPLSAGVFCLFKNTTLYKYGASDPLHCENSATYLMLWESILHGRRNGSRRFDFGKTAMDNLGLRAFKRKWNTVETELPYHYLPHAPNNPGQGNAAQLLKWVIQRSPLFVCRLSGEALYKHFAP
jgi:lipid II:glycine glycyltransferase (peptidoglycan interpeptide bridge formation enzyme)